MMSPSYSYPPQGGSYGYMPTSNGRSPGGHLLPVHQDNAGMSGPSGYPPLAHTWKRLQLWLSREYPELGDTLNYGILPEDLANIEMQLGFALPPAVRESFLVVDGQEAESSAGCSEGLFFGLSLLPLDEVLDEWRFWREVDDDPATGANSRLLESMQSIPPNWVRHQYSQRGWIPLVADKAGNYIGVDLNPGDGGAPGQVIVYGRDFDTKVVLWRGDGPGGWGKWLASFAEELEQGETYEMGAGNESEGSEDGVGYESYYHDGTGGGQGDGGGDSSARVGLRLTGEYRGWNVMDAWADRSIRRWFEAGVISEADVQGKDKSQPTVANPIDSEKSVEVAIPVLAETDDSGALSTPRPDVPTISVTTPPPVTTAKPPAPLPVDLPTARDFDAQPPSPPDSVRRNYADDVESILPAAHPNKRNHQDNMSRLPTPPPSADDVRNVPARASTTSPSASSSTAAEATLVEIGSPDPQELISYTDAPASPSSTSVPPVISAPPSVTPTPKQPLPASDTLVYASSTSPTTTTTSPVDEDDDELDNPDTTIRLVGGGGKAGVMSDTQSDEEEVSPTKEVLPNGAADADDTASIKSVTSTSSKHKKTKSALGGLKKLGLGRKKDSVSSLQDAAK